MTQHTVYVRIVVRDGKRRGQYRSENSKAWFHLAVADAALALKNGVAHIGATPNCIILQG